MKLNRKHKGVNIRGFMCKNFAEGQKHISRNYENTDTLDTCVKYVSGLKVCKKNSLSY